jgi:hypothetical protein
MREPGITLVAIPDQPRKRQWETRKWHRDTRLREDKWQECLKVRLHSPKHQLTHLPGRDLEVPVVKSFQT